MNSNPKHNVAGARGYEVLQPAIDADMRTSFHAATMGVIFVVMAKSGEKR